MIQLFCEGQLLDLPDNFKCNITLKSPFFQNELESGYIYDINLPLTTLNKKILLNFSSRLSSAGKYQEKPVEIFFKGLKFIEGIFIYTGGVNTINGSIGIGQGNFLYLAFRKYLDQVNYGRKTFADTDQALEYFNGLVNSVYPDSDFVLPYTVGYQQHCYLPDGTTGYYQKDHLNYYEPGVGYKILSGSDRAIIVPQLFLQFILKKLFHHYGYQVIDNFLFSHPDYSRLILFNIYNANGGIPEQGSRPGYDSDILNIVYNNHIPKVLISDFITGLQNHINIRFLFNHAKRQVTIADPISIISDPAYTDISKKFIKLKSFELMNPKGFSIKLTYDQTDAYQQQYAENRNFIMDQYGGSVEFLDDLPPEPIGYNYYYVREVEKLFNWFQPWDQWVESYWFLTDKFFMGQEEYSINSVTGTCEPDDGIETITGFGNPAIDFRRISPRILFYNGMVEHVGNSYPSSRKFRGDLGLDFDNKRLYENRWKIYFDRILSSKAVTFEAMFSPSEIRDFDFARKFRIDGIDYLVKELKVTLDNHHLGVSTVDAVKV